MNTSTERTSESILAKQPKLAARLIRESHQRQFSGEDWQAVANDLWQGLNTENEDDYNALSIGPDPDCECGFCKTAPWRD